MSTPLSPSLGLPDVVFLFGLAGVGKNFCGTILARRLGYFFYDLDLDATPAMKQAIKDGRSFTDEIRDEFFKVVCARMSEVKKSHRRVIFAQGAYKERHRAEVRTAHPGVEFVWIDAPDELIIGRLRGRAGQVSSAYASSIRVHFESPESGVRLINDSPSEDDVVTRFVELFPRK